MTDSEHLPEDVIEALSRGGKIDAIKREKLLKLTERFQAEGIFEPIFMVSALTGDGVADLLEQVQPVFDALLGA